MSKIFTMVFIIVLSASWLNSQDKTNLQTYTEEEGKGWDNPRQREIEFIKRRAFPSESIPEDARIKAFNHLEKMVHAKNSGDFMLAQQPLWKNIGPFNVGGRIKSIAVHPQTDGLVYAAAAAGGIWKTTNKGQKWEPIFDFENAISFGSLSIDVNNPNIIYAGTGEAVTSSTAYLGSGLYKTTDGGNIWKLIGLTQVGAFSKVYVHPMNSNFIVAGVVRRGGGFYKSTDGGNYWRRTFEGPVSDVSINPANQNEFIIGVTGQGVFYSSDGGEVWEKRNTGLETGIGRVSVQFAPSNTNRVYALMEISQIGYIYRSNDKGRNWALSLKGDAGFFNNQGFYDNFITVHPTNQEVVIAGGVPLYRTIDGGYQWVNVLANSNMHVDQHCAVFSPIENTELFVGNDGGVYLSYNAGQTFAAINTNLQITQFYSLAIDHSQENVTYGGTQDNGTLGNPGDIWGWVFGGDGFRTLVDPLDPNIIIGESTPSGQITPFMRNLSNNQFKYLSKGLDFTAYVWDPPLAMDPNDGSNLFHGRDKLYVSFDQGESWLPLKTPNRGGTFSAITVSPVDSKIVYAGTNIGESMVSTDMGNKWTAITNNGLVTRYVSDFYCSRKDAKKAWAVFSGFGTPHVYKTTNTGKSWTNVSEGLPDIPVNTVTVHPENENIVFIGTDIGVFATFDDGSNWFPFGRGLARSPVLDLEFNQYFLGDETQYLRAATHGRSIWEVPVKVETITDQEIVTPSGGEIYVSTVGQTISWYGFKPPVKVEFSADDGMSWQVVADNVQGSSMYWNVPNNPTIHGRIKVTSNTEPSQVKVSRTFTILLIEIGSVLKTGGVSYVPYGLIYDGNMGLWTTSFMTNTMTKLNSETLLKEKEIDLPGGDSLFTDLTMDKTKGIIYVHRMNSTSSANGGIIIVTDTLGNLIRQMPSPGRKYPIGIELVDGNLVCGDRDYTNAYNKLLLWIIDINGNKISEHENPFQRTYGPRGLCYDGKKYIYQICTDFPNAGALTSAYMMKIDKDDLSKEVDKFPLEGLEGIINGRGIDYDPRDKNFWVTDYGGNIYKIAGFETYINVQENLKKEEMDIKIYPNPVIDFSTVSFKMPEYDGRLNISLINSLGNKVKEIFDNHLEAGAYKYFQISPEDISSGTYTLIFKIDRKVIAAKKLIFIR